MKQFFSGEKTGGQKSVLFALTVIATLLAARVQANGEIGEHVNDLQANLEEYSGEVSWFLEQVDGIVATYAEQGTEAAQPEKLVDHWEAVKFHGAIETSYVPVYAAIWQGIFGVHDAIREEQELAAVRQEQAALEQAMWQALGAVKMAAKVQQEQPSLGERPAPGDPVAELAAVSDSLERVVAKYAERATNEATSIVHSTYAERFEGVEGALIEQDANLVEDLEKDFNVILPQQIAEGVTVEELKATVADMQAKLERAQSLLNEAEANRRSVF